jgi:mono/diheme cytochrome c family protein
MKTRLLSLAALGAAACADPTPENPTWADVRPIFMANCARCHGFYDDNAAPLTFRLDVMEDSTRGGRKVYGAEAMRTYVVARVIELGHGLPVMPGLSSRQEEMLTRWRNEPLPPPEDGELIVVVETPPDPVDSTATVILELADADGVEGFLEVEGFELELPEMPVHAGLNEVRIDTRPLPDGTHVLNVAGGPDNPREAFAQAVGTITVAHANGAAPAVVLPSLTDGFFTGVVPFTIQVTDPDPGDVVTVDVALRRGVDVSFGTDLPVVDGEVTVDVDMSGVEPGPDWTLVVTATDMMGNTTTRRSGRFVCASAPPPADFGWDDATALLGARCGECHGADADAIANLATREQIEPALGAIYRRVVQTREMPPPSAEVLTDDWPMPDAEREALGAWILGGAPE